MASIKTTSSHRILINGSMKEISLDPETILDIEATSGCDIQIVNLGCGDDAAGTAATSSLLMEVLQQKVSSSSSSSSPLLLLGSFGLSFGGVALLQLERNNKQDGEG